MRLATMVLSGMLLIASPLAAQVSQSISAEEILQRADQVRIPQEGFEAVVRIRSSEDGRPAEERLYKVLSKGNENSIVMTVEPPAERGQILLMSARDLWVFLP